MEVIVAGSGGKVRPVVTRRGDLTLIAMIPNVVRCPVEAVLVEGTPRGAVSEGMRPTAASGVIEHGPCFSDRDWGIERPVG